MNFAALALWAGVFIALSTGWKISSLMTLVTAGSLIVLSLGIHCGWVRIRRYSRPMVLGLLMFTLSMTATTVRTHRAAEHPLTVSAHSGIPSVHEVTVWSTQDPRPIQGNRVLLSARLDEPGPPASVVVIAPRKEYGHLSLWQSVTFHAKVKPARRSDLTVATLVAVGPPERMGHVSWLSRATGKIRHSFSDACLRELSEDEAAVLPGLVLGDTSRVSPRLTRDFKDSGLTHLMAISGANFAIVLGAVLLGLRALSFGPRLSACIAAVVLVGFMILVRPSPSVVRAAGMGMLGLMALFVGRRRQARHTLALAVMGLICVDSSLAVNYGFVLSVLATGALLYVAPRWYEIFIAHGAPPWIAASCAAAGSAHVVTMPVITAMTGTINLVGFIANLLVDPVVGVLTVIGCCGAALVGVGQPWDSILIRGAGVPTSWLVWVARTTAQCPFGSVRCHSGWVGMMELGGVCLVSAALLASPISVRTIRSVLQLGDCRVRESGRGRSSV